MNYDMFDLLFARCWIELFSSKTKIIFLTLLIPSGHCQIKVYEIG